jgi:hypothetical protein
MRNANTTLPRLLTLTAALAFTGCALPDDDPSLEFRTTLGGDGAEFNGAEEEGDEGGVELPECIVVTTEPVDPTGGAQQEPGLDDFHLPGSDSGESSSGDPAEGGESADGDPAGGGDDRGLPPSDPSAASGYACPGEGKLVTVDASDLQQAVAICDRYYGHCCESVCAGYGLVPETSATCAIDADDDYVGDLDLEDISLAQGDYACGCECEEELIVVIP